MFNSKFALIVIMLGLGACASNPKYVPADSADDYGHYSTRLDENRYRIVFNGKRTASLNTTRDYALLRAAELTMQEGHDWFQIVDRETSTDRRETDPAMTFGYQRATFVERNCGLLTCSQSVRPRDYRYMDISTSRPQTVHSHALEIVMGSGAMPDGDGNYYDASSVARSLWNSM
jgi:hypothetical protein